MELLAQQVITEVKTWVLLTERKECDQGRTIDPVNWNLNDDTWSLPVSIFHLNQTSYLVSESSHLLTGPFQSSFSVFCSTRTL